MDARFWTALVSSKLLRTGIKISGGGATTAPGLLAEYVDPKLLRKLGRYYDRPVLVTGTNGKTTTARLIGNILREAKISYIHNRAGSNLLRGIIGTLSENFPLFSKERKMPLLEVDEPTLYPTVGNLDPSVIVFNNLFRDQLDRYGEVEKIRKVWHRSLLQLDKNNIVVLNADDHSVAHLAMSTKANAIYFGVEDKNIASRKLPHASDFTSCISCGGELRFDDVYLSHLGRYRCASCGLRRPKPDVYAKEIKLKEENGFSASVVTPKGNLEINVNLPGIFSVYNTLAAISAALALNIDIKAIRKALQKTKPAFGRTEQIVLDGKKIYLALVKNPAGFNEILKVLLSSKKDKYLLIAINDLIADGRDVSWLWDVDFEDLFNSGRVKKLWLSGIRTPDMALRVKYANKKLEPVLEENIERALENAIAEVPKNEKLFVLPTYTAMLAAKAFFAKKGSSESFWED